MKYIVAILLTLCSLNLFAGMGGSGGGSRLDSAFFNSNAIFENGSYLDSIYLSQNTHFEIDTSNNCELLAAKANELPRN